VQSSATSSAGGSAQDPSRGAQVQHKIFEKMLLNLPDYNCIEENECVLPVCWAFNYTGIFNDMKVTRQDS